VRMQGCTGQRLSSQPVPLASRFDLANLSDLVP
jgi:hypothetical protein